MPPASSRNFSNAGLLGVTLLGLGEQPAGGDGPLFSGDIRSIQRLDGGDDLCRKLGIILIRCDECLAGLLRGGHDFTAFAFFKAATRAAFRSRCLNVSGNFVPSTSSR